MKTSQLATLPVVLISICTLVSTRVNSQTIPAIPIGSLTAYPTVVQTGTKPTLTWSISYPSIVKDYVTITAPATITPKQALYMDIRILGQGVTVQNGSGYSFVPTEASMSYNSTSTSNYKRIFYGTNLDVNPSSIVSTSSILTNSQVAANMPLRFGGRYYYNGAWGPAFYSSDGTTNIRTLVHGDVPPPYLPAYGAPSLASFLKPYLDTTGHVQLGPMDVIVFMELTHTDPSNVGYDFQDMVLLVTFRTS